MTSDSRSNHGSGHWASYVPPLRLPQSASATYSSSHEGSRATLQPREPLVLQQDRLWLSRPRSRSTYADADGDAPGDMPLGLVMASAVILAESLALPGTASERNAIAAARSVV
jgi:hypothetical protein